MYLSHVFNFGVNAAKIAKIPGSISNKLMTPEHAGVTHSKGNCHRYDTLLTISKYERVT